MQVRDRVRWIVVLVAVGSLLLAAGFFALQVNGPSDGARLAPGAAGFRKDGVVVTPLGRAAGGLHPGDVVVAVDGRSMEAWAKGLFQPGAARPNVRIGSTLTYTVMRNRQLVQVPVVVEHYPLRAALEANWGVLLFLLANLGLALFVFIRQPQLRAAQLLFLSAACLLAGGSAWNLGLQVPDILRALPFWLYRIPLRGLYLLGWIALLHCGLSFPQVKLFESHRTLAIRLIYIVPYLLAVLLAGAARPFAVTTLQWLGWWNPGEEALAVLYALLFVGAMRFSYVGSRGNEAERQRLRRLLVALTVWGAAALILGYLPNIVLGRPLVNYNILIAIALAIPIALAFVILRFHAFGPEVMLNRALVYGALLAIVALIYILIVGGLGMLLIPRADLPAQNVFLLSFLAAAVVALMAQPLRRRLQRLVNRLIHGEPEDPYAILSRLGQRLEATLGSEAVLPTIAETVAQALRLPYVAIALKQGEEFTTVVEYGSNPGPGPSSPDEIEGEEQPFLILPLIYRSEMIGRLACAPRTPSEPFTSGERRLLQDVARQAGVAAHTVLLTADLQRSREHLVTAREEERRRLRRDLHDGLGPVLAAQQLKIGAARAFLRNDPTAAEALLVGLEHDVAAALADIRRVVYDLRPPALDELGLVGALTDSAALYTRGAPEPEIIVEAPDMLPPLSAAVEVAVYRIVQEALTNVVRHAQARTCHVSLWIDRSVHVTVVDDGIGLPDRPHEGVGLASMRERAAEVGGTCVIEATAPHGTRVSVELPLGTMEGKWTAPAS